LQFSPRNALIAIKLDLTRRRRRPTHSLNLRSIRGLFDELVMQINDSKYSAIWRYLSTATSAHAFTIVFIAHANKDDARTDRCVYSRTRRALTHSLSLSLSNRQVHKSLNQTVSGPDETSAKRMGLTAWVMANSRSSQFQTDRKTTCIV
jgi:hypothetical protein